MPALGSWQAYNWAVHSMVSRGAGRAGLIFPLSHNPYKRFSYPDHEQPGRQPFPGWSYGGAAAARASPSMNTRVMR
jgi:hypothetical protein